LAPRWTPPFILICTLLLTALPAIALAQGDPEGVCVDARGCDDAVAPAPPSGGGAGPDLSRDRELKRRRDAQWSQDEGLDYLDRRDWDNAIRSFEEALEKDPDNEELTGLLTRARSEKSRARAAAIAAAPPRLAPVSDTEALTLTIVKSLQAQGDALSFNRQGAEFLKRGESATAIALFEIALARTPNDPNIRRNLASARAENAKLPAAAAFARGRQAYASGDWPLAVIWLRDAVAKKPGDAQAQRTFLAAKAMALAEISPATPKLRYPTAWENALVGVYGQAPKGVLPRVRNGFEALRQDDPTTARAAFVSALRLDPGNQHLKGLIASLDGERPTAVPPPRPGQTYPRFPDMNAVSPKRGPQPTLRRQLGAAVDELISRVISD